MNQMNMKFLACMMLFVAVACGDKSAAENTSAKTDSAEADHAEADIVKLDTTGVRLAGIRVDTASSVATTSLAVTGTITYDADRVSHIGARTSGRIISLQVPLGGRVKSAQLLALLESPTVGQIRAQEQEAEELRTIARENFAREQRLAQQGISSRKELLDAEAELRRTESALRSAEAQLEALGAGHGTGGQFGLSSPFGGVVVARDANVGEMVEPTDTLYTVADLSSVWIELNIFERDLARVRLGQSVSVSVVAYDKRTFPGRIVYLGAVLDPQKRTVLARVEIPNRDGALKPGMFASANIQVGSAGPPVVVVAQDAVQQLEGKSVVFVPGDSPGEFRAVRVEVGEPTGDGRIAILSGINAGDRVVVAGAFALRSELAKGEIGEHGH
ncbi:MAG: efflux RND transporter periplasmic adaptor subunit [Gemmatimonas sp.]